MRTLSDLSYRFRFWLDDRLPERRQRVRAASVAGGIVVCVIWIAGFTLLADGSGVPRSARPSPAVRASQDLTRRLREDAAFAGIQILPHLDYPGRLHVTGRLSGAGAPDALRSRLKELDPSGVFVIDVRVE